MQTGWLKLNTPQLQCTISKLTVCADWLAQTEHTPVTMYYQQIDCVRRLAGSYWTQPCNDALSTKWFCTQAGWFKLNTSDWQWPEAREGCEEDGGHLAIPDTAQKISTMIQILEENADILKHTVLKNQVFVGLFYPNRSRSLTTVLGTVYCCLMIS